MGSTRTRLRAALVCAATAVTALVAAGPSSAATLNGGWAPLNRCPVDDPAMLAADGQQTIAQCLAASSQSGSITLGKVTAPVGATDLQLGLVEDANTFTFSAIAGQGGALQAAPSRVPGGLLGVVLPSQVPQPLRGALQKLLDEGPLGVTATVEPAGPPTDIDPFAALVPNQPIVTLPVKIHLKNVLLGSKCYIGSEKDPIVLRPENVGGEQQSAITIFDADGTPDPAGAFLDIGVTGSDFGDDSFAVPRAHGCGPLGLGLLDSAVDAQVGLPSPAGANRLVLNDVSQHLAGLAAPALVAPNDGQIMSDAWHSAVTG